MRKKLIAVLYIWLQLVGAGVFIAIAIGAWFADQKITAIWFGFVGIVCLLLLLALQLQEDYWHEPQKALTKEEIENRRAKIQVTDFGAVPIQDHPSDPLFGWGFHVEFKNVGKTAARNVQLEFNHYYFPSANPPPTPSLPPAGVKPSVADVPPDGVFHSEIWKFHMNIIEAVKKSEATVRLFGEVNYLDVFEGTQPHKLQFCVEILPQRNIHIMYPNGPVGGPFRAKAHQHIGPAILQLHAMTRAIRQAS